MALCFCPYLHQLLIDFKNSFAGTLIRQFAIMSFLHIPPHCKCVSTLPCEILMKYAYIMLITNKHFSKIEKNASDQHCSEGLMSLDSVGLTQTDNLSQCWSEVFFHLPNFLVLLLVFAYIYISQCSVEMHLPCGVIYNNCITANCLQSVTVTEF